MSSRQTRTPVWTPGNTFPHICTPGSSDRPTGTPPAEDSWCSRMGLENKTQLSLSTSHGDFCCDKLTLKFWRSYDANNCTHLLLPPTRVKDGSELLSHLQHRQFRSSWLPGRNVSTEIDELQSTHRAVTRVQLARNSSRKILCSFSVTRQCFTWWMGKQIAFLDWKVGVEHHNSWGHWFKAT